MTTRDQIYRAAEAAHDRPRGAWWWVKTAAGGPAFGTLCGLTAWNLFAAHYATAAALAGCAPALYLPND